ncbi:MAG TPA: hypothetical protein VNH40_09330, partial [Gaiellaceae bacterium]|nr:hypothetical protein [Gaiellaceae bacterium]
LGGLAAGLAVGIPATLALGDALGIGVGYGACIATLVAGWLTVYTLEKVPPLTGPAPGLLVLESAPYIVFGSAFGVMLLEPHLLGWFGAGMSGMPALRTLELSLLLALPPLLLVSGMSDRIVRSFWASAERRQRFEGPAGFRRSTTFFVRRQLTHYTYVLATMSALLVVAVEGAVALGFSSVSQLVFLPGVGAFLLIGVGQLGAMLMLGLGLLAQPVMALLAGIAVVAAAGAPVAAFDFRLAAPAFLVGAAAFAALSLRACLRLRGEADYDYAKAF